MEPGAGDEAAQKPRRTIFRDIRRYYCHVCGICRSKKALITAHILSHHKEEVGEEEEKAAASEEELSRNTCEECGASFRKPAHLKQHMQSHSVEREALDPMRRTPKCDGAVFQILNGLVSGWETSCEAPSRRPRSRKHFPPFTCTLDDCHSSYRRKDHLTRHLLMHQGKLFTCPVENCNQKFAFQGNMLRHVKEFHKDEPPHVGEKQHICKEECCGKIFKYASRLRKHEESHVKMEFVEAVCGEPGCMKVFSNSECLRAHIRSCHQHVQCEVCGVKQLKKNFKRHQCTHEEGGAAERVKCSFEGCQYTYSNSSNLHKHVKAVHEELRPFTCRISRCGKKFPYRHVRDNHERSGAHMCIQGDFVEVDEQFCSRPRGGRKRKRISSETLLRKRVVPPGQSSSLDNGTEYLRWLLSDDQQ